LPDSQETFTLQFNGRPIAAQQGDTVASALYRAGRRIFSRSFKYHRPRGLLCLAGKCPNCMMNVDGVPNVRACVTAARPGTQVENQNAYPSLENDWLAAVQRFDWLMPVGWYYKTLTHPAAWHAAEPFIRRVAGLGEVPAADAAEREYEHAYWQTEVAVIGGGPAGLQAAIEAALAGEEVLLIDDQPSLGGHLRYRAGQAGELPALLAQVAALPNIQTICGYAFGLYEGNLIGVVQPRPHPGAVERLIHLRAGRVVVATGAYEAPLPFENNDLPGVMLSSAAQRLMRIHGIVPGKRAAVVASGERGREITADLRAAGVEVVATVAPDAVQCAVGSSQVEGLRSRDGLVSCDLIVVCGHRVPDAGFISQAGGRVEWLAERGAFVPVDLPPHITAVGEVTGDGLSAGTTLPPLEIDWSKRSFVCYCSDVTTQDLHDGVAEGFDQIETLKRYTTVTMGPCQGKMCQLPAIGICARETGRTMQQTGTTTARPPNPSVTLGALAGARHHPTRRTPMHYEHDALGAVWLDMGEWKRPRYYKTVQSFEERTCVESEYRAVRERVGIIDVSTLGKLDVKGADTGKLLDKVYTNRFSDLRPGRVRYAVLCDEAGIMLDDGTISRLSEDRYFITTTTGNLDFVQQWLEWWLAGSSWDVHVTNVTGGFAAVNVAGPLAREVLQKLCNSDLSTSAFPYMSCLETEVADIPALLLRIGFVGETGWEIHYPAESGAKLWQALLEAGREVGMQPFGVEAQRLLRLEKKHVIVGVDTDALSNPFEAGMGWVVKPDKPDFVGKNSLARLEHQPARQSLVGFTMDGDSLPPDGAAILVAGSLAGRVTSARFSPATQTPVGLAWVPAEIAREGAAIQVRIDGLPHPARVTLEAFYDPAGVRLRM
jgi:sarcosine oxidase subunit alpha